MPPKGAPKKGGEEVDMSDIASLPKANVCLFQVAFSRFKDAASRQKIQDHVTKSFPEDRVKPLTRQEIQEYGKSKQIIEDGEGTKGLTQEQMMAQAAADKIFELTVAARGLKKQKQIKQQEEADAAAPEGQAPAKVETDSEIVDQLIYMVDYPSSKKEAYAFSQYGQAVSCCYEVYQVLESSDGTAPHDLKAAKEVPTSEEEAEQQHLAQFEAQHAELARAVAHSASNAPVRNMAFFRVPYCDVELVELKLNEDGEQATNTLSAEQSFMKTFLNDYLELHASFNLNFQKFTERIDIHQLMPEKETMAELKELKSAHLQFELWKADQEATLNEIQNQKLTEAQLETMPQEEKDAFEAQKTENIQAIETELNEQSENDRKSQERVTELLVKAKRSIDEERDPSYFSDKVYRHDFIQSGEVSNAVPSIVSAMVSQIAQENMNSSQLTDREGSRIEESTEPETLDDLFENYSREIAYDNNLMDREIEEEEFSQHAIKGILPSQVNVYDTLDTSNQPVITLPSGMIEDHKAHAVRIGQREKEAARNIVLPGVDRFMMPPYPQKSKRLRDFENPQFYPFSTLPIEDAERTMQLKAFQRLVKSEKIDEGVLAKERLGKHKIFERKYDQYFTPDIMSQVIQDALRQDPDLTTSYYARTDQLLLILHNKINNQKRNSDNLEKPHGVKSWRSEYRVVPSFSNWIKFYEKSLVHQADYVPKEPSDPPLKYTLEESAIPEQMLDVDNGRVQNLEQTINQFLPDDNSIMNCESYEVGGQLHKKSVVYKDKYSFGISQVNEDSYLQAPEQFGLVSYKPVGQTQFWLNFSDHESKMLIETVKAERNKQKIVEIKPPEPTAEEIAAKEEAAKAAAAAQKGKKGAPAPTEATDEKKEPEVSYQEQEPNFLDNLFEDTEIGDSTIGPCINVTMKSGLIVRHMPNGDVVQIRDSSILDRSAHTEIDRVYLSGGIVVRHFANLDCQILYPNGEVAQFSREELKWTVTNEKGFRREFKDGVYRELPRVNCLNQTDPKTGIVTKVREDNVVCIKYQEGNQYCQHADGTQIFCQEDGQQIRIEKEGFAPVMYQATEKGEDSDEWLETDEIKSLDGMMTFVFLPDGCVVKSIQFYKSSEDKDTIVTKHIYQRADYSCVIVDNDGDFRIVSTNARSAINDEDERARLGHDTDYLKQMYKPQGEYTPGVFYGHLSQDSDRVHIITKDFDKPYMYQVNHQNNLVKLKIEDWERNTDWESRQPNLTFEPEREIETIGLSKNPFMKYFLYPRMFIVNPTGDGVELLSQEQVDQVMKHAQSRDDVLLTSRVEYVDNTQLNSIQVMNKVTTLQEQQLTNQKMGKLQFPEYAEPYVIPRRSDDELAQLKPMQDIYRITNISEYTSFEPLKQNAFIEDFMRFQEWKNSQIRYESEFGIVHHPPKDGSLDLDEIEDNEFYAKRINLKIYKERALMKPEFDRNAFKENFVKAYNTDEDVISFRKKMTTVEKEEQEILAEIERRKKAEAVKAEGQELKEKDKKKGVARQEKKARTKQKVETRLQEYKLKKETHLFASHYHQSRAGLEYYKQHPVKPPSEEVIMRMTQRINRSQANNDKEGAYDGASHKSGMSAPNGEKGQGNDDKDNPIVALEPEENLHQASIDKSKKYKSISQHQDMDGEEQAANELSLYAQEKVYLTQLEQEKVLKAEEHHVIKTKDFNVYGKLRTEKPFVKATQKSAVVSDLNEKFITTECITDRRVKISSMANRQYINAPSVEEVRKQGQHQMILQAINKKQTFSELINQANSMVTSVLHDGLKRSVNILPSVCKFGVVGLGTENQMIVTVKNEDSLSQRIMIKPTQDKRIVVVQDQYGPIAPGMTKKIIVQLRLSESGEASKIKEDVLIMTKSDCYKLPVEASVLSQEEYAKKQEEQMQTTGKSLTNSRVKNRLTDSISMSRGGGIMAKFKEQQELENKEKQASQLENQEDMGDIDEYNDLPEQSSQNM